MRIAFFDSGSGGLTVLKEALAVLPHEDYLYYADTDHVPYGTKEPSAVRTLVLNAVEDIHSHGIKALVVACNTATSIAIQALRERYDIPILGMEPAVKPAVSQCGGKRVLVAATPLTLREEKFQNLVAMMNGAELIDTVPLAELVGYAENFVFDDATILPYLREKLSTYDLSAYGTFVLGCTHFPFYRDHFRRILPAGIAIIDGNAGTVNHLRRVLTERGLLSVAGTGDIQFYTSGRHEERPERYQRYLELP